MSNEKIGNGESKELGLTLDKKTVVAIITALVVIMGLGGVLTQVLPRGEYQVIEKDGYIKKFRQVFYNVRTTGTATAMQSEARTGGECF